MSVALDFALSSAYGEYNTWLALQAQRLSVALHIASAWEIATEMQLAGACRVGLAAGGEAF